MIFRAIIIALQLSMVASVWAQDEPPDSTIGPRADSVSAIDTLLPPSPDTVSSDSAIGSFEQRYLEFRQRRERRPRLVYFDSAATYFTSQRIDVHYHVNQSFYHDVGDFFRSNPSYFLLEHQVTPMRSTVQPFGLSGSRLSVLSEGNHLHPFEHIPEPDGLIDLNDVPTVLSHEVYLLPGPIGRIFGAESGVATLLTRPKPAPSYDTDVAFLADKGDLGYSYVRGKYSKRFVNGRYYDLSIGYRDADGPLFGRGDDSYHYYGDLFFPIGGNAGLTVWGHLYNRDGNLVVRPDIGGATLVRDRADRSWRATLELHNEAHTTRWFAGYGRSVHESKTRFAYTSMLGVGDREIFAGREWLVGNAVVQTQLRGRFDKFDAGDREFDRAEGRASVKIARPGDGLRWAAAAGVDYVETFKVLPHGTLALMRDGRSLFFLLSIGYSERVPTLLELHLPATQANVLGPNSPIYREQGNDRLKSERQLIGSATVELGSPANNVQVSITGGRIFDGIDWHDSSIVSDNAIMFAPVNGDIDFFDVRLQPEIRLFGIASLTAGGAFRQLGYQAFEDKAYLAEYQVFSGMELHVYWPQRRLDLYAYGEIATTGPYHGYAEKKLGQNPVANGKLSIGLKDFRLNFVFQNLLGRIYRVREYVTYRERFFYYSISWNFLN